jgi:hypothetical protein
MALALTGIDEPQTSKSTVCEARPASAECQEMW